MKGGPRASRARLRLELQRSWLALGLYALIIVLGLAGYAVIFRNQDVQWPWQDTVEVRVAVDHAKGVEPGLQQVRIAGVPVGKIAAVELDGGDAILTLSIDAQHAPIHRDALVRLRPATPLEDQYVDILDRGSETAGVLEPGETLPVTRTIAPVDIGRVLDVFDAPTRQRMAGLLESFSEGLGGQGGRQLRATFVELAPFLVAFRDFSGAIADHRLQTSRLIHNFRLLSLTLAERDRQIETLVSDGAATLGTLAAAGQPLDATLRELPPLLQTMRVSFRDLRALADDLDPALGALDQIAESLPGGLEAARTLADAATPALRALEPALRRLEPLARELDQTAAPLTVGLQRLSRQAPAYDRITAAAADCEFAIGKFFQWTASVLKFYDAWGTYPRGETIIGSSTVRGQTPDPLIVPNEGCTQGEAEG